MGVHIYFSSILHLSHIFIMWLWGEITNLLTITQFKLIKLPLMSQNTNSTFRTSQTCTHIQTGVISLGCLGLWYFYSAPYVHPCSLNCSLFFLIRLLESVPSIVGQEYTPDKSQSIAGHTLFTHTHAHRRATVLRVNPGRENTEKPESFDPRRYVTSEGKTRVPSSGFNRTVKSLHFSASWLI